MAGIRSIGSESPQERRTRAGAASRTRDPPLRRAQSRRSVPVGRVPEVPFLQRGEMNVADLCRHLPIERKVTAA